MAPHGVDPREIERVMAESSVEVRTVFDKCTVVAMRLPNGFVLVESSGCVSPEDYDEEVGVQICMDELTHRVWQLYGFLQQERFPVGEEVDGK